VVKGEIAEVGKNGTMLCKPKGYEFFYISLKTNFIRGALEFDHPAPK